MTDSVFITYNPRSELEETLAIRLYTIGAVSGLEMFLPERCATGRFDRETMYRIDSATWFVCFAAQTISLAVKEEIHHAYERKGKGSNILVIYDTRRKHNFKGIEEHFSMFPFDPSNDDLDGVVSAIVRHITSIGRERSMTATTSRNGTNGARAVTALLGIGVGLFALSSIVADDDARKRKQARSRLTRQ